jgi:N-acetylmuramoyl-L-alanine amidase
MPLLVISPSQQEANQYAGAGTGYADSEQAWMEKLAYKVKSRFDAQAWGIKCVVIEEGSVGGQVRKSNALGATEHLALHTNAGGGHGSLVIHHQGSTKGAALARSLFTPIAAASDRADVGIWSRTTYYETRETHAPAVIVEYAFHDNVTEAAEIRASLDEYADATVKGLAAYYGKRYTVPGVPTRYFEVRIHTSEPELAAYKALAAAQGDFLKPTVTPKDSWRSW